MEARARKLFKKLMDDEIEANKHKGEWEEWHPSPNELLLELHHHMSKLHNAIVDTHRNRILEHSADLANICQKSFSEVLAPHGVCSGCIHLKANCTLHGVTANDYSIPCSELKLEP